MDRSRECEDPLDGVLTGGLLIYIFCVVCVAERGKKHCWMLEACFRPKKCVVNKCNFSACGAYPQRAQTPPSCQRNSPAPPRMAFTDRNNSVTVIFP